MSQTKEGIKKTKETMIKRHGSEEAWREYMKGLGSKGGKKKNPNKGFGSKTPEERREYGRQGGRISKRPSKAIKFEKTGDTERVYDTSNLGLDSNSVSNSGGVLRRTFNNLVRR